MIFAPRVRLSRCFASYPCFRNSLTLLAERNAAAASVQACARAFVERKRLGACTVQQAGAMGVAARRQLCKRSTSAAKFIEIRIDVDDSELTKSVSSGLL